MELYDIVTNTRQRKIRSDWAKKFKTFMGWKSSEQIMRIDGKSSMLIIRDQPGLTYDRFDHDFGAELLRSGIVAAISALDRYMHDVAISRVWGLLSGPEANVPKKLKKLSIPAIETAKAIAKIKRDPSARPGSQVKKVIQNELHKSTYQGSAGIDECMSLIGETNFWARVSLNMPNPITGPELQKKLNSLVLRRNQIVHEADLERKISSNKDTLRQIKRNETEASIGFIKDFVNAVAATI